MIIEIKNVKKKYARLKVLHDISFTAESGECIGILGSNGCGKSTLLSILAGVLNADGGEFLLDGHELFKKRKMLSKYVGYVPQGTPLIEELSAKDNLRLWYDSKTLESEIRNGVLKMLGVDEFLRTPVRSMSGGMKKRLSIGCAVSGRPPVLILDEPSAALDLVCKKKISDYLVQYKKGGGIVILTTHDESELLLCDRWFIIEDGVLEPFDYDGDVRKLVARL